MKSFFVPTILATAALAACNPYDPDLGDEPFRCGTDEPKCPDGYRCVGSSPADQVCQRDDGGGEDEIDGGIDIECNDDSSIEPNDTTSNAWTTPIPDSMPTVSLVGLAICPDTDKDLFRFGIDTVGKNMRTTVTTEISSGELALQILSNTGSVIANGTVTSGTTIEVVVNNMSIGTFFVQVTAKDAGVRNNYALDIVTCDVTNCP